MEFKLNQSIIHYAVTDLLDDKHRLNIGLKFWGATAHGHAHNKTINLKKKPLGGLNLNQ